MFRGQVQILWGKKISTHFVDPLCCADVVEYLNGQVNERMNRWMSGWTNGWWVNGWIDGWMDG